MSSRDNYCPGRAQLNFNIIYKNSRGFYSAGFSKSFHLQIVLIMFTLLFYLIQLNLSGILKLPEQ